MSLVPWQEQQGRKEAAHQDTAGRGCKSAPSSPQFPVRCPCFISAVTRTFCITFGKVSTNLGTFSTLLTLS